MSAKEREISYTKTGILIFLDDIASLDERNFKAVIVQLILSKDTEKAVELVSRKFKVRTPKLGIGPTKGKKTALAVYSVSANTILFRDQDQFFNPFVVLHEMYHCIRSKSGSHRGTEKNADRFALDYIEEYRKKLFSSSTEESRNTYQQLSSTPLSVDD